MSAITVRNIVLPLKDIEKRARLLAKKDGQINWRGLPAVLQFTFLIEATEELVAERRVELEVR